MSKVTIRKDKNVTIMKIDEASRTIKGIVYKPNELDSHGDWMTAADIKKSAYTFMKELKIQNVDTKHNLQKIDAYVCENYIAGDNDPDGYPTGSWIVAIKIDDEGVWEGVLNKDYEAFSMYGKAFGIDGVEPPQTGGE